MYYTNHVSVARKIYLINISDPTRKAWDKTYRDRSWVNFFLNIFIFNFRGSINSIWDCEQIIVKDNRRLESMTENDDRVKSKFRKRNRQKANIACFEIFKSLEG